MRAMMILAILATSTLGLAAPAWADTVIPVEWGGIWQLQDDTYDCITDEFLFSDAPTDTLCPGAVLPGPAPGEMTLDCTTTADAGSYHVHCVANVEVVPGCVVSFTYDSSSTRTGDTFTAISTSSMTYTGECFGMADTCERTETTGTRIAGPPASCEPAANENLTWGAVKSSYR